MKYNNHYNSYFGTEYRGA